MTIIRIARKQKSYTVLDNAVVNDKSINTKYFGVYARLIGKQEGWEISASGMAKLYPENGREYFTNAFKHLCKLGYIIRIPQPRVKGRFTSPIMELHEHSQLEQPLTDEQVEYLFQKNEFDIEEIQKIYPKRVFRSGETEEDLDAQQNKEEQSFSKEKQQEQKKAAAASFQKNDESQPSFKPPPDPHPLIEPMSEQAKSSLRRVGMDAKMIEDLEEYHFSNQEIEAAANHATKTKTQKKVGWFVKCIQEKWYVDHTTKPCDVNNKEIVKEYITRIKSKPERLQFHFLGEYLEINKTGIDGGADFLSWTAPNFETKLKELFKKWRICIE